MSDTISDNTSGGRPMSDILRNHGDAVKLVHELHAEIERLRAALTEIASQCHNLPRGATVDRIDYVARRALEQK